MEPQLPGFEEEPEDGGSEPPWLEYLKTDMEVYVHQLGYDVVHLELLRHKPGRKRRSAPARHTDPETSQLAAKQMEDVGRFSVRSRQGRLLRLFEHDSYTDQEATKLVLGGETRPSAFDGCRRRCSDLRAAGFLSDSGRRRKNPGSDDESIVWQITVAGSEALTHLYQHGWSR